MKWKPGNETRIEEGDDFPTAYINSLRGTSRREWHNRILCYGQTVEEANKLRDYIISALNGLPV